MVDHEQSAKAAGDRILRAQAAGLGYEHWGKWLAEVRFHIEAEKSKATTEKQIQMLDALHVAILEKSCALRDENCEWQTFLIRLVTALKAVYKISRLCTLVGLPRSTYYWGVANTGKSDPDLEVVKSAFAFAKGVYGYRRVTDLLRNGFDGNAPVRVNHKKVARLMKVAELKGAMPKRKHYRSYACSTAIIPNLFRRNFRVEKPCTVLVTDITQISWGAWR